MLGTWKIERKRQVVGWVDEIGISANIIRFIEFQCFNKNFQVDFCLTSRTKKTSYTELTQNHQILQEFGGW